MLLDADNQGAAIRVPPMHKRHFVRLAFGRTREENFPWSFP